MQQQKNYEKLDRQQEKLSKNFDSLEWQEAWQMNKIETMILSDRKREDCAV